MELLQILETKGAEWFKQLPHLPAEFRKWLAENAWWLTLIGVVLGGFGIFALLPVTIFATGLAATYDALYPYAQTALNQASLWVSLAFLAAIVVLEAMAISPLKSLNKRGWDLLFLSVLVSLVSSVVSAVLNYTVAGLLGAAVGAVIGLYILFEIRDHFVKKQAVAKK